MREILFKAKRIDNDEWVEGDYSQFCDVHYIHVRLWSLPLEKYLKYDTSEFEVNPNTISRFIGSTDKNSKKIWENDIVKIDGRIFRIHYYEPFAMYMLKGVGHGGGANGMTIQLKESEVIGNIFDNPELLEEQTKLK